MKQTAISAQQRKAAWTFLRDLSTRM